MTKRVRLLERVLVWVLRGSRARTTPSCGEHCSARILTVWGEYVIPGEYHCGRCCCHGREDTDATAA